MIRFALIPGDTSVIPAQSMVTKERQMLIRHSSFACWKNGGCVSKKFAAKCGCWVI